MDDTEPTIPTEPDVPRGSIVMVGFRGQSADAWLYGEDGANGRLWCEVRASEGYFHRWCDFVHPGAIIDVIFNPDWRF